MGYFIVFHGPIFAGFDGDLYIKKAGDLVIKDEYVEEE